MLAEMGRALWADPAQADLIAAETLGATALLDLTEERALEKAALALLERATRDGMAGNLHANLGVAGKGHQPFFRLFPEERFLLVALHIGRWSYSRLAVVMGETQDRIEELAWKTRLHLVSLRGGTKSSDLWLYPVGTKLSSPRCPEYDLRHPWTQRFLDEEMPSSAQRLFLQNHLMACSGCQLALNRCRDLYYAVDAMIPRLDSEGGLIQNLASLCREGRTLRVPAERTFSESLAIFFSREEIRWFLAIVLALFVFKVLNLI